MISISPVFTEEHVNWERVIALDQRQYYPLIALPVDLGGETGMAVRFQLSSEERERVAAGGDLVIMELVGKSPYFTPIALGIVMPGQALTEKEW